MAKNTTRHDAAAPAEAGRTGGEAAGTAGARGPRARLADLANNLAKRAGRWLGLAADPAPLRHTTAVEADRFDQMTWAEVKAAAPAVDQLAEDLGERYDYAEDLLSDVFLGAYKHEPKVRPAEQMDPGRLVNHKVVSSLLESPEWDQLRRDTTGDQYAAAMAVLSQAQVLRGLLDHTREAQQAAQAAAAAQQAADEQAAQAATAFDQAAAGADEDGTVDAETAEQLAAAANAATKAAELADSARTAAEAAANAAAAGVRGQLRRAAEQAAAEAAEEAALMRSWGVEPGQLQRMSFEQRANLARRLRSGRLGEYAELIGRFRTMATGERARKVEHAPGELVGITLGDDLGRLLPSEIAQLGVPALRPVFAAKFAESRLMLFDTEGEEIAGQGAIIACVDTSGSMRGDREAWAKACALALLDQARAAGRDFVGILFSSAGHYSVFPFPGERAPAIAEVIDFAESFLGGGTDFASPLTTAAQLIDAEYNRTGHQRADIVLITDGECEVTEDWMRTWQDTKHRLGFRVFGIGVATTPGPVLDALSDNLRHITDMTDPDTAADLFRVI